MYLWRLMGICVIFIYSCHAEESPFHLKEAFMLIDEAEEYFFSTIKNEHKSIKRPRLNHVHTKDVTIKKRKDVLALEPIVSKSSVLASSKSKVHETQPTVAHARSSAIYPKIKLSKNRQNKKKHSRLALHVAKIDLELERRQRREKFEQAYQDAIREVDGVR